jgi:hypothetical protein
LKLKIVPIANDINPHTVRTALTRFLNQLPVKYQIISGGVIDDDYHDEDFGQDLNNDESLTIALKVKSCKH